MKGIVLQPMIADDSVIVQFTANVTVDKNTLVKVPNGFQAIALINEKAAFRINAGADKKLVTYGKEYSGKQCRVAFVRTKPLSAMMWGFGDITVNNERLKENYRVGANGKYTVEISEIAKLINGFDVENNITTGMIREKTISILKNSGQTVLGKYFAKTDISVFEISAQTDNVRAELFNALKEEPAFLNIGVKLNNLTVEKIHVNEGDLELIRNRAGGYAVQDNESRSEIKEELSHFKDELSGMVASELRQSEQRLQKDNLASVKAAMESHRDELSRAFYEQMQKQLNEFGENISLEIEDRIIERLPLKEAAKSENFEKTDLTAKNMLYAADKEDDYVTVAGKIYSKVETNLKTNYKLPHSNKFFYIDYKEYVKLAGTIKIGDRYPLKRLNKEGSSEVMQQTVLETAADGTPVTVEMCPFIRFIKAGLVPAEAQKASDMWRFLNRLRHKNEENDEKYWNWFYLKHNSKKEYLEEILDFYQRKRLYSED